jgi:hypothetical protein
MESRANWSCCSIRKWCRGYGLRRRRSVILCALMHYTHALYSCAILIHYTPYTILIHYTTYTILIHYTPYTAHHTLHTIHYTGQ